jgi:hypothetical protein
MTHTSQKKEKRRLLLPGSMPSKGGSGRCDLRRNFAVSQAASRGALDGFIGEAIEDHILEHLVDPKASRDDPPWQAAEELVEIVHSFLT